MRGWIMWCWGDRCGQCGRGRTRWTRQHHTVDGARTRCLRVIPRDRHDYLGPHHPALWGKPWCRQCARIVGYHPGEPLSGWEDSQLAPFIRRILQDPAGRDAARLELADFMESHGHPGDAERFRHPKGAWKELGEGRLSWDVDPWVNGGSGFGIPLHANGFAWDYPGPEWLRSERCADLVHAWLRNGVGAGYPWVAEVIRRFGIVR